jgi:hypothetical protein
MSSGGKYVKEQLNMVSFNFLVFFTNRFIYFLIKIDIKTNPVNLSANIGCKLVERIYFYCF